MIRLLITGGTLDKGYNELDGSLHFSDSHLPAMLRQARCNVALQCTTLMLKDSLDMDDNDRETIRQTCQAAAETQIVITHGTDTMAATARHLASLPGKTIVLCGAMVPFSFGHSDALFNLGGAIIAIQLLPPGVYIVMNGQIFNWDNVQKIPAEGRFAELPSL